MSLNVVFHGDSITAGQGATTPFSSIVASSLGIPEINEGYGAYTTNYLAGAGQLYPNFDAHVHVHYDSTKTNIVVFQESTNSLYYGQSVAQEQADLITYANYARSKGWKVVVCNVMQRGTAAEPPTLAEWRTRVSELNTWFEWCWPSFADSFARITDSSIYARTEFSGNGDPNFFADAAHPNDTGHSLIAPIVESAIRRAERASVYQVSPVGETRVVHLSGVSAHTIYIDGVGYTYKLSNGSPVQVSTPAKMTGYVSAG